jgi:hypothetical protein
MARDLRAPAAGNRRERPAQAGPVFRATDALPDAAFATLFVVGALGAVELSAAWVAALIDLALWELPIQFGASIAIACALSVRALHRPWLVPLSAAAGWLWAVGSFYWRELSNAAPDQAWHLVAATSAVFAARWGVTLRRAPAAPGLDQSAFAAAFAPMLQSALFYGALVIALLVVAIVVPVGFHVEMTMTDAAPRLAILAIAYGGRALTCLPPIARRIHGRLERIDGRA